MMAKLVQEDRKVMGLVHANGENCLMRHRDEHFGSTFVVATFV